MGRAETVTKLPLGRYAQIMHMDLCHFNQVNGAKAPMRTGCDDIWDQQAREDLAWTMKIAETMIEDFLDTYLVPTQVTAEAQRMTRTRPDWWNAEFGVKHRHLVSFGTESFTLVQADAPVTYEDRDNDPLGREETAVIGTPAALYQYPISSCDEICDVRVYFREEDGAWDSQDPRWEIRPLRPDIDGDYMTIIGPSCMFVRPELWEIDEWEAYGNPDEWIINFDINNLVHAVDVYCRSVSTATPITLYWEGVCDCGSPCAHTTQTACPYITDQDRGFFAPRPSTWNGTSHTWAAPLYNQVPVRMTYNYIAGFALDPRTCRMDSRLERAVVKLTNALLPEPPCGYCDAAETLWKQDREPIDPLTPDAANLPWDLYSKGALDAWKIVRLLKLGTGGHVRSVR